MLHRLSTLFCCLVLLVLGACAQQPYHQPTFASGVTIKPGRSVVTQPGDTLYSFARRNNASMREIIDLNHLAPPYTLTGGTLLKLPASEADLPSVELGPIAAENEKEYKKAHRGKPTTLYSQVAPQTDPQPPESSIPAANTQALQAEAARLFQQSDISDHTNVADAGAASKALQLQPMQFDEERQHLAEAPKPVIIQAKPTPAAVKIPPTKSPKDSPAVTKALNKEALKQANELNAQLAVDPKSVRPKPAQNMPAEVKQVIQQQKQTVQQVVSKPPAHETKIEQMEHTVEPKNLAWPVQGQVISTYGPKSNGMKNDGINIAVPRGTPVLAADGGTVAYAGDDIPGYGRVVLVRHPNGLMTTYAHLDRMFVQPNSVVAKGDLLGTVGTTGGVDTPQLHFEIRRDKEALDPGKYLYR